MAPFWRRFDLDTKQNVWKQSSDIHT